MVLFAYIRGWIIIRYPKTGNATNNHMLVPTINQKKAKLAFRYNEIWNAEEIELMWSQNKDETMHYLINNLLSLMHQEDALNKKISLGSVMVSPNGQEAFISFDRKLFGKEDSTFEKWMIIESILITNHENEIPIKSVCFLVHHKPLEDYYLYFLHP